MPVPIWCAVTTKSFSAPPAELVEDGDLFRERIMTTTSGLLGLIGIEADPLQSREHILIANILEQAWKSGEDLTLPALIQRIQTPPMRQIGVFDLDAFYPAQEQEALMAGPGEK